jgi:hypothetical protein
VIIAGLLFVTAALIAALSGLIGDEVRGWLELAPRGMLRLAAIRLPAGQRRAIYDEEWLPELLSILRGAEDRPITRLIVGTRFSLSIARGAGRIGRTLAHVREEPERVVHIRDSDTVSMVDDLDVYQDNHWPIPHKPGEVIDSRRAAPWPSSRLTADVYHLGATAANVSRAFRDSGGDIPHGTYSAPRGA